MVSSEVGRSVKDGWSGILKAVVVAFNVIKLREPAQKFEAGAFRIYVTNRHQSALVTI
jgi:hypothetical protein